MQTSTHTGILASLSGSTAPFFSPAQHLSWPQTSPISSSSKSFYLIFGTCYNIIIHVTSQSIFPCVQFLMKKRKINLNLRIIPLASAVSYLSHGILLCLCDVHSPTQTPPPPPEFSPKTPPVNLFIPLIHIKFNSQIPSLCFKPHNFIILLTKAGFMHTNFVHNFQLYHHKFPFPMHTSIVHGKWLFLLGYILYSFIDNITIFRKKGTLNSLIVHATFLGHVNDNDISFFRHCTKTNKTIFSSSSFQLFVLCPHSVSFSTASPFPGMSSLSPSRPATSAPILIHLLSSPCIFPAHNILGSTHFNNNHGNL
jgi:hypothetical protein